MNTRTKIKQQFSIQLAGEAVVVSIAASARKSLSLRITAQGEIDLRVPWQAPKAQVLAFLQQHEPWLIKKRAELAQLQQSQTANSNSYYFLGKAYALTAAAVPSLRLGDECLFYPSGWSAAEREARLALWRKHLARQYFEKYIERWWPAFSSFGSRPVLRVKTMKTRWGSLSQRGYINMNALLLHMPEPLIELVIVHELCHLKYFDHGAGFKALMQSCLPDLKEREKALLEWGKKIAAQDYR